ncbi:MAG TPA: hypothetical protein VJK52_02560 [Candidatus Nanoarchaeia archaeon]|nr:hypothetical protein [Candidatus Nanoarchaeia archaeon]
MEIGHSLSLEECTAAEAIFAKLASADAANVRMVTGVVDRLAKQYAAELHERVRVSTIVRTALRAGAKTQETTEGYPFFAVYAIGSLVHKPDPRDTDVLVATNAWWQSLPRSYDWFLEHLGTAVGRAGTLEQHGELPDRYNVGLTAGKVLFTLHPAKGKNVDITYVRSMESGDDPGTFPWDPKYKPQAHEERIRHVFNSEAAFIAKDVGTQGEQLPRVILYRAKIQVPQ